MRVVYFYSIAPLRRFEVNGVDHLGVKLDIGGLRVAVGTMSLMPGPITGSYVETDRLITIAYALTRSPFVVRPY